jgi:hypothetical protein
MRTGDAFSKTVTPFAMRVLVPENTTYSYMSDKQ